ncbi:MAG: DNA-binding protein, partial [Candidatus Hermodarchaeota archaeon]|nr:DNA-binding protein [Candidatus Hermodarchaeota archaeon]
MSEDELEELRRRKMAELQQQAALEQQVVSQEAEIRAQRAAVLRQILTPEARERLANLRMVKAGFAEQLENELIRLAQMNRLPEIPITDKTLKTMLSQ